MSDLGPWLRKKMFEEEKYPYRDLEYGVPRIGKRIKGVNKWTAAGVGLSAASIAAYNNWKSPVDASLPNDVGQKRKREDSSDGGVREYTQRGEKSVRHDSSEDKNPRPKKAIRGTSNVVTPGSRTPKQQKTALRGEGVTLPELDQSVSNLQRNPQMQGHDDHEVPVIPPPRKIAKTHPDYFTINLPVCIRIDPINVGVLTWNNSQPLFTIRLNSIYDPLKQYRTGNDFEGNSLGDPMQNKNIQPKGRDIWATHFKYYRVLKSEFDVSIDSTCACECQTGAGTASPWENKFCYGYELTDEDGQISNNVDAFLTTKMAKRKMLQPAPAMQQTYWDGAGNPTVTRNTSVSHGAFSYTYHPATWRHHVEEAGVEERWTPINQNPGIDHELHMRMFHMHYGSPAGRASILITGYYTVQFRETLDSFFKDYDITDAKNIAPYTGTGHSTVDD